MTVPMEYRQTQRDFDAFMIALRDRALLQTTHQTYTMLDSVFRVFRARLTLQEFARFADGLPPVLRALFVQDWDPAAERLSFGTAADHAADVMKVRQDHNLSTPTAIQEVDETLKEHLGTERYAKLMAPLSPEARQFWQG